MSSPTQNAYGTASDHSDTAPNSTIQHPSGNDVRRRPSGLDRQPRLARPTDADQRHQPMRLQLFHERLDLIDTTHERRQLDRKIPHLPCAPSATSGTPASPTWKIRSNPSMPFRRCSPKSTSTRSRTKPAVADDTNTCPPWPASITLAAKFNVGPE